MAFSKKIRLPGQKGRLRTDYLFTRDMAKELAMVEQTEGGRLTSRPLQLTFEWQ
ncbi:MAG: antA/AntB antirepressor family protein [Alphaproteobacteria bacterium]|nr:antA/AntB antirepressor family protein [Alphaproteobacteria bacterium]